MWRTTYAPPVLQEAAQSQSREPETLETYFQRSMHDCPVREDLVADCFCWSLPGRKFEGRIVGGTLRHYPDGALATPLEALREELPANYRGMAEAAFTYCNGGFVQATEKNRAEEEDLPGGIRYTDWQGRNTHALLVREKPTTVFLHEDIDAAGPPYRTDNIRFVDWEHKPACLTVSDSIPFITVDETRRYDVGFRCLSPDKKTRLLVFIVGEFFVCFEDGDSKKSDVRRELVYRPPHTAACKVSIVSPHEPEPFVVERKKIPSRHHHLRIKTAHGENRQVAVFSGRMYARSDDGSFAPLDEIVVDGRLHPLCNAYRMRNRTFYASPCQVGANGRLERSEACRRSDTIEYRDWQGNRCYARFADRPRQDG